MPLNNPKSLWILFNSLKHKVLLQGHMSILIFFMLACCWTTYIFLWWPRTIIRKCIIILTWRFLPYLLLLLHIPIRCTTLFLFISITKTIIHWLLIQLLFTLSSLITILDHTCILLLTYIHEYFHWFIISGDYVEEFVWSAFVNGRFVWYAFYCGCIITAI